MILMKTRRVTRRAKIENDVPPTYKEKFTQTDKLTKFVPKTEKQALQLKYLQQGRTVVWAIGAAGTGKSMTAAYHAAQQFLNHKIDKIVLIRANVSVGKSLGMLPGSLDEKLGVFFTQTIEHLKKFMGKGKVEVELRNKTIFYQSVEHLRGHSLENAFVLIEEAQNLTAEELEMILSRIGDNSQFCFTGDQKQTDLKANSGLIRTINLIEKTIKDQPEYMDDADLDALDTSTGVVQFTMDDVIRSGLCKAFVKMYHHN
jgi:phosphate starvation-inducible PhoH-like protein